jgi:hypothetical protein
MPKQDRTAWDPMPIGYPMAAPGTVGLWHWTDYTQTEKKLGSVEEVRHERDLALAQQVYAQAGMSAAPSAPISDPWAWHEPVPISYPLAAPGTIGRWHWTDYTHTEMHLESADTARLAMENEISAKQWQTQAMYHPSADPNYHSWGWIDPMPISYPTAAPGTIGLWHWTDYTHSEMKLESAEEARRENQKKVDQQTQDQMNKSQSNK